MNFIASVIAFILFLYVALTTVYVDSNREKPANTRLLKFSVRFLQVFFAIFILVLMYVTLTFLCTGSMTLITSGFIDLNYAEMIEGYEVLLVTFSILIMMTNFFILEFVHKILASFDEALKFNEGLLSSVKMISNLFIIRILIQVLMNAMVYGSLTLSIEYVFIYALMIVLINIFVKAVKVQKDSDLSI